MDEEKTESCWGVAKWTIIVFAGIMTTVWLFGGFEPVAIAANTVNG